MGKRKVIKSILPGRRGSLLLSAVFAVILAGIASGQRVVVDKTVATINDAGRTELITYSDLLWQLAMMPNAPIDPPSSEALKQALEILINQRLFALEAERIPQPAPTEAEINARIADIISRIPSVEFERRLRLVGFDSVKDPNFQDMIRRRVAIDKYLDFRFRAFVVVTPDDEARHYKEVWVPEFIRRNGGAAVVPPLEEVRGQIHSELVEARVATAIETFLDEAKTRAEIVIHNPV